VAPELRARAYDDSPLPIGEGQTISQPLMVAIMLELLALTGEEKVMDVGSGSGYQSALLSLLAREVVAVERIAVLAERAAGVLAELGYTNITTHIAGDALGWQAEAPYDAIVVGAAALSLPQALVDQLCEGGRMVLPVGGRGGQELMVVQKSPAGVRVTNQGRCNFVPLIWEEGSEDGGGRN
jgi:protein-L-isoaspartate(D-aspartate) O-methyltransferase